jgi:uncharacterized protein (DUF697 family)
LHGRSGSDPRADGARTERALARAVLRPRCSALTHARGDASLIIPELKKALDGCYDDASDDERGRAVEEIIRKSSRSAAVAALQPVSFVDIAVLTPLGMRMARAIARIRGIRDAKVGRAIFRPLVGRLVLPHLIIAGVKFIPAFPVVPDVIASSIAYATTYAIGEVTDGYYRTTPTPSARAVRERFEAVYHEQFKRLKRSDGGRRFA